MTLCYLMKTPPVEVEDESAVGCALPAHESEKNIDGVGGQQYTFLRQGILILLIRP